MSQDLDLSITTLRRRYLEGDLTPRALLGQLLPRLRSPDEDHVWIHRLSEEELAPYLARLDHADPAGLPLYGIPFAIKDNIDLAGVPTTAGCPEYAYTPTESAFVVQRLLRAGAVPVGKTNLDQFATGLVGTRSPYGATRNAFDPAYISGGSSSGSAVAVAKGLVSFALGTDTAGSGRVPAAFNNLVGVKATRGLISTRGVVPACRTLDCVTLFALDIADARAVSPVAAAFDPDDPYAREQRPGPGAREGFRFGVPFRLEFHGDTQAEALFLQAVERLRDLGGEAVRIDFAPFLDAAQLLYEGPWVAERYAAIQGFIESRPEALYPVTRAIIEPAREALAVDAFKAAYRLQGLRREAETALEGLDFVLTPTAPTIYRIAEVDADPLRINSRLGHYTNFINLLDLAAVAVPAGFRPDGLPFGVTLFGPAFADRALTSYAERLHLVQGLAAGATGRPVAAAGPVSPDQGAEGHMRLVVCGAHMSGLPLNHQLLERGGRLLRSTRTAPRYRFYALPGGPPHRPGLIRQGDGGGAIEVEVWELPVARVGDFLAGIPAPLGLGRVELADGGSETGFICEGYVAEGARDITALGSWRRFLGEGVS